MTTDNTPNGFLKEGLDLKKQEKQEIIVTKKTDNYQKSNFLIGAKYRSSIMQEKLFATALSTIQNAKSDQQGNLVCEMHVTELCRLFGCSQKSLYNNLNDIAKRMTGSMVGSTNPETQEFAYYAVIISAKYSNGIFTLKFNGDLKSEIMNIKQKYTILSLPLMLKFRSIYTFRLYEIFKSDAYRLRYQKQENFYAYEMNFSLAELKLNLGVVNAESDSVKRILNGKTPDYDKAVENAPEQVMEKWADFKKGVLDVAIPEINEKSDLNVSYTAERAGRGGKIVGVTFLISLKEDSLETEKKDELKENEILDLMDEVVEIINEKISMRDIRAIVIAANGDMNKVKKAYSIAKNSNTSIDNLVGFIISAIKEGWDTELKIKKELKKKERIPDFPQNKYNFEELEKKLLDN